MPFPQNGDRLGGPPPSPVNDPAASDTAGAPGASGPSMSGLAGAQASPGAAAGGAMPPTAGSLALGMGAGDPATQQAGLIQLGQQISDSMKTLATAAPVASLELSQARALVMQALAKIVSASTASGAMTSPAGSDFPGGGFTAPTFR